MMLTLSIICSLTCCIGYMAVWGVRGYLGFKNRNTPDAMRRYDRVFEIARWVLLAFAALGVIFLVIDLKITGNGAS